MEMPASLTACLSDTASVSSIACVIACPLCRPFLNRKPERSQHTEDARPTRGARRSPPLDWLARPDAAARRGPGYGRPSCRRCAAHTQAARRPLSLQCAHRSPWQPTCICPMSDSGSEAGAATCSQVRLDAVSIGTGNAMTCANTACQQRCTSGGGVRDEAADSSGG